MCGARYIASGMRRHEIDALFVAVHGLEGEGGRLRPRVENFGVFGGDCFGVECLESSVLSLQQPAKRAENQAVVGEQSTPAEVR